jgi:polysaccharide biosynthesis/export protein
MRRLMLLVLLTLALAPQSARAQAAGAPNDAIRPGDYLHLIIFREPELSGDFQVPDDGVVMFGMIGPLQVTGMKSEELRLKLVEMYAKYLVNYTIRLDLLRKVTIAGAVMTPGVHALDGTKTVRDAVAIAGGVAPTGRMDRIELRRDGELVEVLMADRTIADSPIRSGDQIYVPEKSYVSRNGSTMIAAITGVVGIIVTLLVK